MNERYFSSYTSDVTAPSSISISPYFHVSPSRIYIPARSTVRPLKCPKRAATKRASLSDRAGCVTGGRSTHRLGSAHRGVPVSPSVPVRRPRAASCQLTPTAPDLRGLHDLLLTRKKAQDFERQSEAFLDSFWDRKSTGLLSRRAQAPLESTDGAWGASQVCAYPVPIGVAPGRRVSYALGTPVMVKGATVEFLPKTKSGRGSSNWVSGTSSTAAALGSTASRFTHPWDAVSSEARAYFTSASDVSTANGSATFKRLLTTSRRSLSQGLTSLHKAYRDIGALPLWLNFESKADLGDAVRSFDGDAAKVFPGDGTYAFDGDGTYAYATSDAFEADGIYAFEDASAFKGDAQAETVGHGVMLARQATSQKHLCETPAAILEPRFSKWTTWRSEPLSQGYELDRETQPTRGTQETETTASVYESMASCTSPQFEAAVSDVDTSAQALIGDLPNISIDFFESTAGRVSEPGCRDSGFKRIVLITSNLTPMLFAGFECARNYSVEMGGNMTCWAGSATTRVAAVGQFSLVADVGFCAGALSAPLFLWLFKKYSARKRTILNAGLILHICASALQLTQCSLHVTGVSRLLVGLSCAVEVWSVLSFSYETLLSSGMPLASTAGVGSLALGVVLVKTTELGNIYADSEIMKRPFFLQNTVLICLSIALILCINTLKFIPNDSALGYMRRKDNLNALRLILMMNTEMSSDAGRSCLRQAACILSLPRTSFLSMLKASRSFQRDFTIIITHFLWSGLGTSFFFNGLAQEVLYVPNEREYNFAIPAIILIVTTVGSLISYIPAYLVIRSVNRAVLILTTNVLECTLLVTAAFSLNRWRTSDCLEGTKMNGLSVASGEGSRWVAVICILAYYQVLYSLTMPAALCHAMQSLTMTEAPTALLCAVIIFWLPSLFNHTSPGFSNPEAELCGASGRLLGTSLGGIVSAAAVFFFMEDRTCYRTHTPFVRDDNGQR